MITVQETQDNLLKKIARSTGGLALVLTAIKILGFVEKQVFLEYDLAMRNQFAWVF